MNVLSLFDGISCGQVALERAGIKVDKYFASEIDKYAIQVTQKNYPNTIQLGDVTKIHYENGILEYENAMQDVGRIDLLIGGSPCQGFSFAGKQLNFDDERSKLFFEFVRLLEETKPKYFLLENVRMKKEYQDIISQYLGVGPVEINSNLLSAQNRRRLYWTNIPNITQPKDKGLLIKDILDDSYSKDEVLSEKIQQRFKFINSSYAIGTTRPGFRKIGQRDYVFGDNLKMGCLMATDYKQPKQVWHNNILRKISPIEAERFQTLPDNYTEGISNTQRYTAIGNGWTVDVIAHIFKEIR